MRAPPEPEAAEGGRGEPEAADEGVSAEAGASAEHGHGGGL